MNRKWSYVLLAVALAACTESTTSPAKKLLVPNGASRAAGDVVTGAVTTTTNTTVDGTGHCKNGNEAVNCNIYDGKDKVWLSGIDNLGPGTYFFAVLEPGGQGGNNNPNDGTPKNLSDLSPTTGTGAGDAYTNRVFTKNADGSITYNGTHTFDSNEIRLMPYDDTPNNGGVYVMAVCAIGDAQLDEGGAVTGYDGYPVDPSKCKYDAFKIQAAECNPNVENCGGGEAAVLTISKDVAGTNKRTYTWDPEKSVDKTVIKQVGGSVTFNYTIEVSHDVGGVSDVKVTGTISVSNPNVSPIDISGVTDNLSDNTACTVTNGGAQTIPSGITTFAYSCDLTGLPAATLFNHTSVSWPLQFPGNTVLAAGSANFDSDPNIPFTENAIDECAAVSDSYAGALGNVCVGDANPKSFTYSRTVPVPTFDCVTYPNTVTTTSNDLGHTATDDQSVQACGPHKTGGLTMGFWQNKNGQGIITGGAAVSGVCKSGTWLRQYAPFQDLSATATCAQVGTYVTNVIKAASAAGTSMNPMLKGQMLATALDVYFSDAALGGNKINAPSPIGAVAIDLTQICKMIDGSGGVATCSGTYQNVGAAFGGATSLTVSQILAYAASQSNAGGSVWYGQVKATQELAKNTFDAINNQVAF
jgi:hypothetical protein